MHYLKNVTTLEYNAKRCTGCGICVEVCPQEVFELRNRKVFVRDQDACMECGACMMNCAFSALSVQKGVGCAAAIIGGALKGSEPQCGCAEDGGTCC